jgi:hemolysin D
MSAFVSNTSPSAVPPTTAGNPAPPGAAAPAANAAPALGYPALELLVRYRAVLGAAWAARHELAGPKRLADEAAFLPAALEIQETPVHPSPRRAIWAILALFS